MKNYDTEREGLEQIQRSFTLCGIEFHCYPTMPGKAFGQLSDIESGRSDVDLFTGACQVVRATLRPESRDAWDQLLDEELDVPLSFRIVFQIAEDLVQEETGRPPQRPSPSGNSAAKSSTSSMDGFVSPAAKDSIPSPSVPV